VGRRAYQRADSKRNTRWGHVIKILIKNEGVNKRTKAVRKTETKKQPPPPTLTMGGGEGVTELRGKKSTKSRAGTPSR